MARILIVEDQPETVLGLTINLEGEGYDVESVGNGRDALARLATSSYDLVILDLMLPGIGGEEVLSTMRERGDSTFVLILSAKDKPADKIDGFRRGADAYLTKGSDLPVLLARVEALLRRAQDSHPAEALERVVRVHEFGLIRIDTLSREVSRDGRRVKLRGKEYDLLVALVRRSGEDVHRNQLLEEVWGYPDSVRTRTLETHVHRLRAKLEEDPHDPRHIITVHGSGYRFVP